MSKTEDIRAFVLSAYIETHKHVFVSDVAKQFNTSAQAIRAALGYDDFIFENADRWSGSNYCGRYVQAPCVEPAKTYLAKIIKSIN